MGVDNQNEKLESKQLPIVSKSMGPKKLLKLMS